MNDTAKAFLIALATGIGAFISVAQFLDYANSGKVSLLISAAVITLSALPIVVIVNDWRRTTTPDATFSWNVFRTTAAVCAAVGVLALVATSIAVVGASRKPESQETSSASSGANSASSVPPSTTVAPETTSPPPPQEEILFDDFHEGLALGSRWMLASTNETTRWVHRQVYVAGEKLHLQVSKDNSPTGANAYLTPILPGRPIKKLTMKMALVSQDSDSEGAAYLILTSASGREHRIFMGPGMGAQPVFGYYVCRISGTCKDKQGANLEGQVVIPKDQEYDVTVEVTESGQLRLAVNGFPAAFTPAEPDPLVEFKFYLFSDPEKRFDVSVDDIRITYADRK